MPHRLVLALKQLIDNAIDSIQAANPQERILQITTYVEDHDVHLIVEDSGTGVAKAIQMKIFHPFFSTKPKHLSGCRGIRLSIVQQVLNEHSATITMTHSTQLTGAKVLITFPVNGW